MTASEVTLEVALEHGLTEEEYQTVLRRLNRAPNLTELGIISVMWSEHCSYKSSRKWLKTLPTEAPHVIQGPGENAGVIDIGDGKAAIFKMESHNHPSFIEPYQGAATGVGGIMRDVFTMGARPVANMNALRFGAPGHAKTRHLVSGVVEGIGGYGNCMGVPTVGGEVNFHAGYNGNILVNAMTVGVADKDKIFYSAASGVGNPVVYVGSKTGRDGIHGATMASAEFDDQTEEKRPTVQVGDPFTEKLLLEACLELMSGDAIIAIQDMGAAGLTSSSVEMASKGEVGIEIDLDQVPARETHMTAYELMLSESQERMLMVLRPGREQEGAAIFEKWGLDYAIIGRTTDTGHLVLMQHGEMQADLPIPVLADEAPIYDRPWTDPSTGQNAEPNVTLNPEDVEGVILKILGSPDIASRRWIWEQYDHTVMADTIDGPGSDAAVVRVHGSNRGLAITTDVTPRYCKANPFEGGKQAVAEAWRNLSATGALPLAITDCLNFGNPERPEIMGQFVKCIEGMAAACAELNFPVISGNVSLYNETNGEAIPPTPAVGGVGLLEDLTQRATIGLPADGLILIEIGVNHGHLGQSIYLREIEQQECGDAPNVDLMQEKANGDFVRSQIACGRILACHDVSDGGLATTVAEMVLAGDFGAELDADRSISGLANTLFGEDQSRYVVAVRAQEVDPVTKDAEAEGISCRIVGKSGGQSLKIGDFASISIKDLRSAHETWLPTYMSA